MIYELAELAAASLLVSIPISLIVIVLVLRDLGGTLRSILHELRRVRAEMNGVPPTQTTGARLPALGSRFR